MRQNLNPLKLKSRISRAQNAIRTIACFTKPVRENIQNQHVTDARHVAMDLPTGRIFWESTLQIIITDALEDMAAGKSCNATARGIEKRVKSGTKKDSDMQHAPH